MKDPKTSQLRIALTGAPASGKTSIVTELSQQSSLKSAQGHSIPFVVVPEAATQIYAKIGRKWNQLSLPERRDAQRAIYRLQVEQEQHAAQIHPNAMLIMDRGTVDGSAYWPDGPDAYWHDLNTTHQRELARYDRVILLESAATIGIYDGDASNAIRFESADEAVEAGRLLARLWSGHPNLTIVPASPDLSTKIARVRALLVE
jgi:predicted ATPase